MNNLGTEDIYMTSSNSAFVLCEEDNPVFIRSMAEGQVYGDADGVIATTFSGHLISLDTNS